MAFPASFHGGASDVIVVEQSNGELSTHVVRLNFGRTVFRTYLERTVEIIRSGVKIFQIDLRSGGRGILTIDLTPEMLARMNLRRGPNDITYKLRSHEIHGRIFLLRHDTRLVIVDIDGTITRSDVLGLFLGGRWWHTGVAQLLRALQHNGYQVVYLSARPISMAARTRESLMDGDQLPIGPVILNPTGFFRSIHLEVIRRQPHQFKVPILFEIQDLFGEGSLFAGFGNRSTDEFTYALCGIPGEKIFIVNEEGHLNGGNENYGSLLRNRFNNVFPPR